MTENNRATRYIGRHHLRSVTTITRCFDCGRQPTGTGVGVRYADGVAGFAGLVTCGRIWVCPVCNAKVMARRALEIGVALAWAAREGLHVIWGSLTTRHKATDDLAHLLDVQRDAWRRLVQSRHWSRNSATVTVDHLHTDACATDCERKRDLLDSGADGRVGYIRAAELTIGVNGWHPHFHPMIFYRGTREAAESFAASVVEGWITAVTASGGEALGYGAQHLRVIDNRDDVWQELDSYVSKAVYDAAVREQERRVKARRRQSLEAVWSQGKTGRNQARGTVSHWSLLVEIGQGIADGTERWWELEEATAGHRMITWSRGLRAFAGIGVEKEDEEIAAEEVGTKEDTLCVITPDGWRAIRDRPDLLAQLLDVTEADGWVGLRRWLDGNGIDWLDFADLATAQ